MKRKKERGQNGFVKDMLSLSDPALAHNLSLAGGHEVSTYLGCADAALPLCSLTPELGVCGRGRIWLRWPSPQHTPTVVRKQQR